MGEIKSILHLHVGQLPASAKKLIEAEKKTGAKLETMALTPDTAQAALEKIFETDAICIWSETTPFIY